MLKHTKSSGRSSPSTSRTALATEEQEIPKNPSSDFDNQVSLPQRFVVKYLGFRETSSLWGIKYTRRPVDEMVAEAKKVLSTNPEKALPLLKLEVTEEGILVVPMPQNTNPNFPLGKFGIECISYGVQDLVYTRVFAIIVVKSDGQNVKLSDVRAAVSGSNSDNTTNTSGGSNSLPFKCHAFVTDSRQTAKKLTYSLASAFQMFSQNVAAGKIALPQPKKFAIDLRSPEDLQADMVDSEA